MSRTCPELLISRLGEISPERPCGRQLLEGSNRCIFHDSNAWRMHAELLRKEIREKVRKGDLNFQKYNLPRVNFSAITKKFTGPADFREAKFHGHANFSQMTFLDTVNFSGAEFFKTADFARTKFSGNAVFEAALFSGRAAFQYATFLETVAFVGSLFSGFATFGGAKFSGFVWFTEAEFSGYADFSDTTFSKRAWFGSTFSDQAIFDYSRFHDIVGFGGVSMSDVHFFFKDTIFERGVDVDEDLWSKSRFRLLVEKVDLADATDSYHALRRGFEDMGHYKVAGELFYHELRCRKNMLSLSGIITYSGSIGLPKRFKGLIQTVMRIGPLHLLLNKMKSLLKVRVRWSKFFDWLWMRIFYLTCGFGERPLRVVGLSFATVFFFALAYYLLTTSAATAIYLSCDCFVTLGVIQGTVLPISWRWLTYVEAALGLFMISLFLVVFTRKMSRD